MENQVQNFERCYYLGLSIMYNEVHIYEIEPCEIEKGGQMRKLIFKTKF